MLGDEELGGCTTSIFLHCTPNAQAVGTPAKMTKNLFNLTFQFDRYFGNVYLRSHGLVQKGRIYQKCLVQASVA